MPSDLQGALKTINKYTYEKYAGSILQTEDKVFLLSEYEVRGTTNYTKNTEANYQAQYDYYKDNGNVKRQYYKDTDTATSCYWWLRSPYPNNSTDFAMVYNDGSVGAREAYIAQAFAPAFVVG
jgi:hypothetical protein